MATQIFLNLPVNDLPRSIEFFKQLGYTFNPQFTDETATCMIICESIYVMLLTHPKFKSFTPKEIADAHKVSEVFIVLSCENRAQVDDMIRKAVAAGGTAVGDPQDHGFMYGHSFFDLDGHTWEYFYMDPSFVQPQ